MRVLIAEDDAVTRMLLMTTVSGLGHECFEASDGGEAWSAYLKVRPEVLITDRNMPVLDGLELCRRVRSHTFGHLISIILVTGRGSDHEVLEGVQAGADDYLIKPVEPLDLQVRLIAAERLTILHRRLAEASRELMRTNDELAKTARTDALTGVGNRRRFDEDLARADALAVRQGGTYGVAVVDVDHFKPFNDQFGHQAGDDALVAVAAALEAGCRAGDVVYRYGGEEFAVIYTDCTQDDAVAVAERLRSEVEAIPVGDGSLPASLTVSVGVALSAPDREGPQDVVAAADGALYRAKDAGRNRVMTAP